MWPRLTLQEAARASAKAGDMTRGKALMHQVKTLEGMLTQAQAGASIKPSDIPPVPGATAPLDNEVSEAYNKLSNDLVTQATLCKDMAEHMVQQGDASWARRFKELGEKFVRDLGNVKKSCVAGHPPPAVVQKAFKFPLEV